MRENEVKNALETIEPEAGAQERMYANILKKAAAQRVAGSDKPSDPPAPEGNASADIVPFPARRPAPAWKQYRAMAACLAVAAAVTLGALSPFPSRDSEADDPPVMAGSPFEDVTERGGF